MNDLLREASKRAVENEQMAAKYRMYEALGMANTMTNDQRKRHQAKLDETRPLKGRFSDYLTGLEPYKQSGKHADIKPQPLHT